MCSVSVFTRTIQLDFCVSASCMRDNRNKLVDAIFFVVLALLGDV